MANLGPAPVSLPPYEAILLASAELSTELLPPDTVVWPADRKRIRNHTHGS